MRVLPTSYRGRVLTIVLAGVSVRVLLLLAAGDLDPYRDESSYVYVAAVWARTGFYPDRIDFLWPPGYPAWLALWLQLLGVSGLFAAKLAQCGLGGVVGLSVAALARRLFGGRAALLAAGLWAVHLPLAAYTHLLWPETAFLALFLPAIVLLLAGSEDPARGSPWRLLAAGVLLGAAALVKESALPVVALSALALLWRGRGRLDLALPGAAAFVLGALAVVLPWSLRNHEVYGRFSLLGATTGKNAYIGVNGHYRNFDVPPRRVYSGDELVWRLFVEAPPGSRWERSEEGNVFDRSAENLRRGKAFAATYPGYFLRSRVKRAADWVVPLSFLTRHVQSGRYGGWLARPAVGAALVVLSIATTLLVLAGAVPGFCLAAPAHARPFLAAAVLGVAGGTVLVAVSRYRVPVEPLFLVLAAGALSGAGRPWRWASPAGLLAAGAWLLLAFLWLVDAQEVLWVLREVLA